MYHKSLFKSVGSYFIFLKLELLFADQMEKNCLYFKMSKNCMFILKRIEPINPLKFLCINNYIYRNEREIVDKKLHVIHIMAFSLSTLILHSLVCETYH